MRFRDKDKAFIMACLVLCLLLGIFLLIDVSGKFRILAGGREPVGTVLSLRNDARCRAPSGASGGVELGRGSAVLDGDAIITGPDSSAVIALKDGSLVELCGDSAVAFDRSGDDMRILVEKGCAGAKRPGAGAGEGNSLRLLACDKIVYFERGELSVVALKGGSAEIYVRSGKAVVMDDGSRRVIIGNEQISCGPDALTVERKRLILVEPSENICFYTGHDTAHVEFSWDYKGERPRKSSFLVDIGRNRSFSPADRQVTSPGELVSADFAEGEYFWRVSVQDDERGTGETSETRRFSICRDDPFSLLSPSKGETIEYKNEAPMITFAWEPHPLASSYALEVSERKDFSNLIKRIDSRIVNFSWQWKNTLKPGKGVTLYWRVTAAGGPGGWKGKRSDTGHFTLKRSDRLQPPRLVYPEDGRSMSRARVDKDHVVFSWEKTEDNLDRKILFSRDRDFGSIFRQVTVEADHWAMRKSLPAGSYFWRVALHDGRGNRKAVSASRLFELRDHEDLPLVTPKDGADISADEAGKSGLGFAWKRPDLKGNYLLELSVDRDFKKINRAVTTDSVKTTLWNLSPGNFYWRVRLLSGDGGTAAASETRAFTVREGMPEPAVIFPRSGGDVTMLTENELKFSWKPMKGINAYEIELHQLVKEKDKTRDRLVLSTQTADTTYTVSDLNLLDVGNFYWTLRAVKKDRNNRVVRYGKKVKNNFNINLGDSKIIIISPEIQVIEDDRDK